MREHRRQLSGITRFGEQSAAPEVPVPNLPYEPKLLPIIQNAVNKELVKLDISNDQRVRYFNWLVRLQPIALETEPDSEERRQRTRELVNQTSDPDLSRRIARIYFGVFEKWRKRLFTK